MRNLILGFALVALTTGPILASEQSNVMVPVHQFIDGLNKGDAKSALAACAPQTSIIDDFPPHQWTACADWARDFDASSKQEGVTDGIVTLGTPRHVDVTGDRAYVVVPANYAYKVHGKPVTESGSIFTVVLRKFAAGWRITGWAWAKH